MTKRPFYIATICLLLGGANAAPPNEIDIYSKIRSGSPEGVRELVESGVPINQRDSAGNTLLMQAVMYGNSGIVKYLLERGADANLTNHAGATALMRAAGSHEKIKLLVKGGA